MADTNDGNDHKRKRVRTEVGTKSRTKQSETEATNVNTIMRKYQKTGVIDHWNQNRPTFGDFSMSQGLHANMIAAELAQDEFMKLDAHVRKACDNEPVKLLELMTSPEGLEVLREAGMLLDPPIPKPDESAETPTPPPPEPPAPAEG